MRIRTGFTRRIGTGRSGIRKGERLPTASGRASRPGRLDRQHRGMASATDVYLSRVEAGTLVYPQQAQCDPQKWPCGQRYLRCVRPCEGRVREPLFSRRAGAPSRRWSRSVGNPTTPHEHSPVETIRPHNSTNEVALRIENVQLPTEPDKQRVPGARRVFAVRVSAVLRKVLPLAHRYRTRRRAFFSVSAGRVRGTTRRPGTFST